MGPYAKAIVPIITAIVAVLVSAGLLDADMQDMLITSVVGVLTSLGVYKVENE